MTYLKSKMLSPILFPIFKQERVLANNGRQDAEEGGEINRQKKFSLIHSSSFVDLFPWADNYAGCQAS